MTSLGRSAYVLAHSPVEQSAGGGGGGGLGGGGGMQWNVGSCFSSPDSHLITGSFTGVHPSRQCLKCIESCPRPQWAWKPPCSSLTMLLSLSLTTMWGGNWVYVSEHVLVEQSAGGGDGLGGGGSGGGGGMQWNVGSCFSFPSSHLMIGLFIGVHPSMHFL